MILISALFSISLYHNVDALFLLFSFLFMSLFWAANFQDGDPIYSSQMVRFRFGYSHTGQSPGSGVVDCLSDQPRNINMGDYVWTYESPAFPMAQV